VTSSNPDRPGQHAVKRENGELELPDGNDSQAERDLADDLEQHTTPTQTPTEPASVRPESPIDRPAAG
jgi:hypothetical protein